MLFSTKPRSTPRPAQKPQPKALGYLAFPPNTPTHLPVFGMNGEDIRRRKEEETQRQREQEEKAWAARAERDAETRRKRLAKEEEEAKRGEEDWVRSGGILRNKDGMRDVVRTEAIREELRLREAERVLKERWEEYERLWGELLTGRDPVRFQDIPWPVDHVTQVTVLDLTAERVKDFLFDVLKVRGNKVTRRDRVRSSLLRWHPDKMTGIMARVVEEDIETVKQAISAVILCLQQLNSTV